VEPRDKLIQSIRTAEYTAQTIEAVNELIPHLSTPTLQRKYGHKMVAMIREYEALCFSLKQEISDYLKFEASQGNKRSMNLRRLMKSL
jgi:hypothetical protein